MTAEVRDDRQMRALSLLKKLIIAILIGLAAFYFTFWPAADWNGAYYHAGRALLALKNPYSLNVFFNPPYALPVLALLSLPGPLISRWLVAALSIAASLYTCQQLRVGWFATLFYFISAPVITNLIYGNLDALIIMALFVPPTFSVIIASVKPQTGIGLIAYHAWQAWREKRLLRTMAPLTGLAILSVWALPAMLVGAKFNVGASWNMSVFPYGLPIAALLMYAAIRYQRPTLALAVGVFVSPYIHVITWAGALVAIMDNLSGWKRGAAMVAACVISWVAWFWIWSR